MKQLIVRITAKAKTLLKRSISTAAALVMLTGVIATATPIAHAQNAAPAPRVSFTFDDGYESFITEAAPALAAYGMTGTAYMTTDYIGTDGFMTWEQTQSLQNDWNWEIGGHTVTHPLSTEIPAEQLEQEMADSKAALAAHGIDAVSFATPFGDYNDAVQAAAARYYTSHRGFHDIGENVYPYNDQLLVNQQVQAGVSVADVKEYVDRAIANNTWLILTFHDIKDNASTNPDDYEYATADLEAIAAYVQSKNVTVSTVRDGLLTGTNKFANGDFNNGINDGWSTDSPSNVVADGSSKGAYPTPVTSVKMTAGTSNIHLFSPMASVNPANTYIIKGYMNVTVPPTAADSEIAYFVDEYNANGDWISGKYLQGITLTAGNSPSYVRNVNFAYQPTSADVSKVRLQVIVTANSGITAYVDNVQLFPIGDDGIVVTPPTDTTPPALGGVVAGGITQTSATIYWGTSSEPTTGAVHYGPTKDYGSVVTSSELKTNHSVELTGLAPGTTYQFQVVATDEAGNTTGTAAGDYSFTTLPADGQGDETGPIITNFDITPIGNTGVNMTWNTDEIATYRIDYGTTTAYGETIVNPVTTLTHWANLTGLTPDTTYYFQITVTDLAGNDSVYVGEFSTDTDLIPGDVNGDGNVGIKDATIVSINWGKQNATRAEGDVNGDGTVGIKDATIISLNWSQK